MTILFGWWLLPLLISAILCLWVLLTPAEPPNGYFSFPDVMVIFRGFCAAVGILFVWLVYFIILAFP